jgi:hypothetical protein
LHKLSHNDLLPTGPSAVILTVLQFFEITLAMVGRGAPMCAPLIASAEVMSKKKTGTVKEYSLE